MTNAEKWHYQKKLDYIVDNADEQEEIADTAYVNSELALAMLEEFGGEE